MPAAKRARRAREKRSRPASRRDSGTQADPVAALLAGVEDCRVRAWLAVLLGRAAGAQRESRGSAEATAQP